MADRVRAWRKEEKIFGKGRCRNAKSMELHLLRWILWSSQNASLAPSECPALCLRVRKSSRGKLIVLIAPWRILVRSHNSTKQPKWQQWAQHVPVLPFAAPPWRRGSNVLPRGMLTGNGTWTALESSSVTEIFLSSPASSLKPLAIVARNDCTNCSTSALLRHTKRISISFFGVFKAVMGRIEWPQPWKAAAESAKKRRRDRKPAV